MDANDLMRQNVLEFVCEPVTVRSWFRERSYHQMLEQRILDASGNQVGRVTEQPPRLRLNLRHYVPREESLRGAVYDRSDAKILEFVASDGLRRRRFFDSYIRWGRRLEVTDGAGTYMGTLVTDESERRATVLGSSSECVGATSVKRGGNFEIDCAITDSTGTDVGWIATPRTHSKRLSDRGMAVPPTDLKRQRLRTFLGTWQVPERHYLAITGGVSSNLRLMLLAVSAAIHLGVVETPAEPDNG
jgi:hypothetical protein